MHLDPEPDSLTCAECGAEITDSGYLPATAGSGGDASDGHDEDDVYEPREADAVCGACGFNELGFAGCAPELDDVVEDETMADVLLQVAVTDSGIEVLSAK